MLLNSLKRLNKTNRLITVDDISDSLLAGRSAAHTACWKYLQLSSFDAALEHAEQIIKREPEKPDGYVFKARALFQKGRYQEAEEVLLKVMKIAEDNDLIRSDVEGMVKLKDELANSRVEILRSRNFREPIDIAEMHWNDCHKPILELIGFVQSRGGGGGDKATPMEVDRSIIDIIGPERAKQLYPELQIDSSPLHKSTPVSSNGNSFNSFSRRRTGGFSNLDLSGEFPIREKERVSFQEPEKRGQNTSLRSGDLSDLELRTAGLKTALLLAEEKNEKYERKMKGLEEELRKVYERVIKLNNENKTLEKKCNTLVSQLDKVVGKGGSSSAPVRREQDPDIQILREVAATKRRKALQTLRKPGVSVDRWRPFHQRLNARPQTYGAKSMSQSLNKSPKQRTLVFNNSSRKPTASRLRDVLKDDYQAKYLQWSALNRQNNNVRVNEPTSSTMFNKPTPMNKGPEMGGGYRKPTGIQQFVSPTQYERDQNNLLEFERLSYRRPYPPGILPAPSYLSMADNRDMYNRLYQ